MQTETRPEATPTSYQYRKMLNRQNMHGMQIIHDIPRAEFTDGCVQKTMKMVCPCFFMDCGCCRLLSCKQVEESTYTWVMENRMELNRPFLFPNDEPCSACCCRYRVRDAARVHYFDDSMYDYVSKFTPCCCTCVVNCNKWCCGSAGETVLLQSPCPCCPCLSGSMCCRITNAAIHVSEGTADKTVQQITKARDSARARMT